MVVSLCGKEPRFCTEGSSWQLHTGQLMKECPRPYTFFFIIMPSLHKIHEVNSWWRNQSRIFHLKNTRVLEYQHERTLSE